MFSCGTYRFASYSCLGPSTMRWCGVSSRPVSDGSSTELHPTRSVQMTVGLLHDALSTEHSWSRDFRIRRFDSSVKRDYWLGVSHRKHLTLPHGTPATIAHINPARVMISGSTLRPDDEDGHAFVQSARN
ncbi:hypothetical protein WOLCODRAFT_134898 [Wolfiporia cocos MD-104 SS10]|uniref:Uncharacterized protein n=1 Tax=Wolfiporia cocos (strain MD-104) TaxID=742152 RepID=A0A2H3ISZ5_WOLCO|nr:hypothetical protein WOLCODRAFT_134898 [Wolfiporia cocos MD-104 SS10]